MCRALQKALYLVASHKVSGVQDEARDIHLQMSYDLGRDVQCSLRNVASGRGGKVASQDANAPQVEDKSV